MHSVRLLFLLAQQGTTPRSEDRSLAREMSPEKGSLGLNLAKHTSNFSLSLCDPHYLWHYLSLTSLTSSIKCADTACGMQMVQADPRRTQPCTDTWVEILGAEEILCMKSMCICAVCVQEDVGECYEQHIWIYWCFPRERKKSLAARILFLKLESDCIASWSLKPFLRLPVALLHLSTTSTTNNMVLRVLYNLLTFPTSSLACLLLLYGCSIQSASH